MRDLVGSCPLDCPDACSWVVTVDDEARAVKLRGNEAHPFTAGGLCKKVNPWLDYAADPSRLTTPLRRTGPKGSGQFEEISWDEALATIAERMMEARSRSGGESIWPFWGTGHMGWIQGASGKVGSRLFNLLGASGHHITICSISGHHGLGYTLGTAAAMDAEDVVDAGLVVLWGSNTLVSNQHAWPFIQRARDTGAKVVVVDPARTRTARRADHHLALLPGTDGALAFGLCRAVAERGGVDHDFLADHTVGWSAFRQVIDGWTVERTAATCGLSPAAIERLADDIVSAPPLAVKLGQGMQRHANGGQAARAVSCLPAITGAYHRQGGGLLYSSSPAYQLSGYHLRRPDLRNTPARTLAATNLAHNLLRLGRSTGEAGSAKQTGPSAEAPVEVLMLIAANPVVSNPAANEVRAGLERSDLFTVAIDLYPTETVAYADIVLPSAMQHEQLDVVESFAHLYLNWNSPSVSPPGEALPHTEIFRRLARALAEHDPTFDHPLLAASDEELAADLLRGTVYEEHGIGVEVLRSEGFVRIPDTSPYRPFAEGFPTPSGRFEFASERARGDGVGLLPSADGAVEVGSFAQPVGEAGSASPSLALIARASDWHINSTFAGTAKTLGRTGEPALDVDPFDAERFGVAEGQRVWVGNDRGRFTAVVRIGGEARPGVVVTTKGWWNLDLNTTVREADSDMGRGAVFHDTAVVLSPLD